MAAPIRCSSCGASSNNGDTFQLVEPILVTDIYQVEPGGPDGLAATERLDAGVGATPHGRPEIACESCGYQWVTRRPVDWMGQR